MLKLRGESQEAAMEFRPTILTVALPVVLTLAVAVRLSA